MDTTNTFTRNLRVFSYNCNGIKSCTNELIHELCNYSDLILVSEHWLQEFEIPTMKAIFKDAGFSAHLKSSVDPEEALIGRPHLGVGFVFRKIPGLIFKPFSIDNQRLCGLSILQQSTKQVLLNVFGVYLPYFNGSPDQIALYAETLDHLQTLIDNCNGAPVMIAGDMNASLPKHRVLHRNWFKCCPFNQHSLILHDFLVDNNLCVADFEFSQQTNYTYFKGNHTSYIDHVFISKFALDKIKNCQILPHDDSRESDHIPIRTSICLQLDPNVDQVHNVNSQDVILCKVYPKINWENENERLSYTNCLTHALSKLSPEFSKLDNVIDIDDAKNSVNKCMNLVHDAIHETCKNIANGSSPNVKRPRRVPWWT